MLPDRGVKEGIRPEAALCHRIDNHLTFLPMNYLKALLPNVSNAQRTLNGVLTLGTSLITAELLFKFGSFTLETLAFLGTWYLLFKTTDYISSK